MEVDAGMTFSCLIMVDLTAGDALVLRALTLVPSVEERFGAALDEVVVADAEACETGFFRALVALGFSATSFNE
ncbi:hypothetical protein [Neorhizobium sp. NCHU2750]|uniref:hypothetical protein n=1 Tax=Neorhizobium sp. NCHU2750 TaxID=1825976 RepID=UPI0013C51CFE